MKLIRKVISTTIISSVIFVLIFSITFIITLFILNLKELSNQTIRILSDWNALDRITNDVLYYRLDSVNRLESIEVNWLKATHDLDKSFHNLKSNRLLKLLPSDINQNIEKAWYLWLFSKEKLMQGQKIFNNILFGQIGITINNIDKTTFYEELLLLKEMSKTYREKQIYQGFLSRMYVLDITSNTFSVLLNDINKRIPDEINTYIFYLLIVAGGSLFLVIFVSLISARRVIQPITVLAKTVRKMSNDDYPVHFPVTTYSNESDEIGIIHNAFNRMAIRIHALYNESLNKEKEKRKAQFRALQYQINPHFLYNTLATLQMTAAVHGDSEMAETIQALGRLLRNTISKTEHFITVSEELSIMEDYIKIIQIRYKNRLVFDTVLPERIKDLFIPSLILQPLLENSVLHGLSTRLNTRGERAVLRIEGNVETDHLLLSVYDNGRGIEKEKITGLLVHDAGSDEQSSVQIGLKNIHDRIVLLFGSEFGVKVESTPGEFTRVILILPLLLEEKGA